MYWTNLVHNGQKQLFQEQNSRELPGRGCGRRAWGPGWQRENGNRALGFTVSLEWGGAARSVSPHGMQISCVRRGVRWAGLSSVCDGGSP